MFYSIKNREDLKKSEELVSLKRQVEGTRLQDKLGKPKFHENIKRVFEPITDKIKITSEEITKTLTESSIKNNQTLESLNNKVLEIKNDRVILASCLLFFLSKITIHENTTQFKLVKYFGSNRVNDLLIHNTIPVTLHNNLTTFRDTSKEIKLEGDLLKMITNKTIMLILIVHRIKH